MKARTLVLLLLLFLSFNTWLNNLSVPGIDFYHYWGVAKAQQLSPAPLASPYLDSDAYASVLNRYADTADDTILKSANTYRRTLDLTGTPLLYTFFAWLPKNYGWALGFYRALQVVLFVLSIVIIGILKERSRDFLSLGLVLSATFAPFMFDLRVANLNAVQLFLLVTAVLLVDKSEGKYARKRLVSGLILLCLSIFTVLLKPSLLLPVILLGISFLIRYGIPRLTVLIPTGIAFAVLIVVSTSVFLGSNRVWIDWYEVLSSSNDRLIYPIDGGNFSATLLISSVSRLDIAAVTFSALALLVITLCGVAVVPMIRERLTSEQKIFVVTTLLKDTCLVSGLVLTATLALSPLVWPHYYTLLLFPSLWLLDFGRWNYKTVAALLSLLFSGGILYRVIGSVWILGPEQQALGYCLGTFFVWVGLLLAVGNTVDETSKKVALPAE